MTGLKEFHPKTIPQFLEHIERLQEKAKHGLWYRGVGVASHTLLPSLYRHPKMSSRFDVHTLERQIVSRFRQRSIPYHTRNLSDDWDALFFMQHYGVPTRLLDWTENPLTALHFALVSAPFSYSKRSGRTYKKDAAVWVWDPVLWNKKALEHISYAGGPLSPGDDQLAGYSSSNSHVTNAHPVALYGAHNSARIVAQQGVFAIFGKNPVPMEELVTAGGFPPEALSRVVIDAKLVARTRTSLLEQGITETTVFPDLEGLARETKRYFKFEE